jgi:hypothetical protein
MELVLRKRTFECFFLRESGMLSKHRSVAVAAQHSLRLAGLNRI